MAAGEGPRHLFPSASRVCIEPPEDPEDTDLLNSRARLCPSCIKFATIKRQDPPLSLKPGIDFGSYRRIGLIPLSLMERHIVSKYRHYSQVVKIESNSGRQVEHTQCCIKGCCIAFSHDSPKVCSDLLSKENILSDIGIHFVGPEGSYDTLLQKTRTTKSVHLFARAHVVYQWLHVLKMVHPLYRDEPDLPPFEVFQSRLDGTIDELLARSLSTTDGDAVERTNIARDDVAGIRSTSQIGPRHSSTNNDNEVQEEGGELSLRYTYLTYSEKTEFNAHTDSTHEFLSGAARTLGVNVDFEREKYKEAQSRRSADPVNEFSDEGKDALVGGWPDIFLLGMDSAKRGCLSDKQIIHLLMQFTTSAASCQLLLFYLFDRKQRHGTIQSMSAKIKQDPRAFENFTKTFMSTSFQQDLQRAVADPEGRAAKKVMSKLVPVMTAGSRKVSFGALQRRSTAGEILAMGRKYGAASNFLTVSVDDVNSPGVLRMAFRSCDNINFPAHCPDSLLEAMQLGDDYVYENRADCIHCAHGQKCELGHSGEIRIPCGWEHLAKKATQNPVSVALHYKKLIHDLLTILVGVKPGTTSGDNNRTTKTEYRGWSKDSLGVIVGTPAAYLGVTETTARGSLHFHVGECAH